MSIESGEVIPNAISVLPDGQYRIFTGQITPETAQDAYTQESAMVLLRNELRILPDAELFRYFKPSIDILPMEKEDITHHLRDHSGHMVILTYLYMHHLHRTGEKFTNDEIEAVLWAAVYHDAKRINDREDPQHGELIAAEIEKDGACEIFHIPERLRTTVCTIIRQHVPEDTPDIHRLTRVFKDMDNLLWIRTHDLDHRKFRYMQAMDMLPIAYALLNQTKEEMKNEKDGYVATEKAARKIRLLN